MDYLKLFQALPNFNFKREITTDDFYNPTLYKWDGYWIVSWISDEGDSMLEIVGDSPEESIMKSVEYIQKNYPSYYNNELSLHISVFDEFETKILSNTEPIPPEIAKIVNENFLDLL